jgi:hypothetical protein
MKTEIQLNKEAQLIEEILRVSERKIKNILGCKSVKIPIESIVTDCSGSYFLTEEKLDHLTTLACQPFSFSVKAIRQTNVSSTTYARVRGVLIYILVREFNNPARDYAKYFNRPTHNIIKLLEQYKSLIDLEAPNATSTLRIIENAIGTTISQYKL